MTDSYKKEKLNEVVTEYIEDGDSSIISFYQDLVGVLTESIEVNEERVNKLRGIKEIINGGIDNVDGVSENNQQEYIDKHNPWKKIPERY
jgi:hypothetical protein